MLFDVYLFILLRILTKVITFLRRKRRRKWRKIFGERKYSFFVEENKKEENIFFAEEKKHAYSHFLGPDLPI